MAPDLQRSVRGLGHMLVPNLAFLLGSVLTDPGTSGNFPETSRFSCLCGSRLPDSGTSGLRARNVRGLGK
jgi:hypothetical protein